MLELKNICKTYQTKGGVEVQALKNVTLSFEDKGMVFLLGKSGSGKSTLLNLCGGLDAPDSGEIIVKGRSSKDFSGADFDSYRNTFVGFVFQEYNILDEFTVEDNIALALELQGKKKDKAAIDDILRQVDLDGYAKRKPVTLSGGQKQRIAIARALVKNPEIIMGDEPTGALDSNTGKQVFDTLKKLSRDKLVLIVSHDREFAEAYADRIIELADGHVVSDVIKSEGKREDIDGNVTVTDTGLITVKKGSELTPVAIKKINELLKKTESDIIISTDGASNAEIRKAGKINDDGGVDVFRQTETQPAVKEYSDNERKFIRSRLPAGKAVKIGASGLKGKPFRLLATVFLSCVAFILFGLMSTFMMYNPAAVKREAVKASSDKYLSVTLRKDGETLKIGDTTISNMEKSTGITPVGVLQTDNLMFGADTLKNTEIRYTSVYNPMGAVVYDSAQTEKLGLKLAAGEWPGAEETVESALGKVKVVPIAISRFHAQMYIDTGISNHVISANPALKDKTIKTYADLVGMPLTFGTDRNSYYRISGIFDCGEIDKAYEGLSSNAENWNLQYKYTEYMRTALHTALVINAASMDGFVQDGKSASTMYIVYNGSEFLNVAYRSDAVSVKCVDTAGNTIDKMRENDVYIPYVKVRNAVLGHYGYFNDDINRLLDSVYKADGTEEGFVDYNEFAGEEALKKATPEIMSVFSKIFSGADGGVVNGQTGEGKSVTMNIAGIAYDAKDVNGDTGIVSDAFVYSDKAAVRDTNEIYKSVLLPISGISDKQLEAVININDVEKPDASSKLTINTPLIANIDSVSEIIGMLGKIFLYTGIALAVFAALLLFNFISASIAQKKKEIGILRAVGARGSDVFKIFFAETMIIVGVCLVLSLILSSVLCFVINGMIKNQSALVSYNMLIFGPLNALIIIAIAIVVAVVGTFVPVYLTARKKPVEAIRSL